jgi:RNA polymerase sigma factor (sigma-70 family)
VPVLAWLYRIASNRVNRWARRERKRAARQLVTEPTGGGEAPGQAASDREYARAALLTLPPKHQTVLALHYLEGIPIKDIALTIGCREGTVKSRLARGRQALRQRLQQGRSQP